MDRRINMSVSSLESRERQYTRDLERLNKDLTSAVKKESDALKKLVSLILDYQILNLLRK